MRFKLRGIHGFAGTTFIGGPALFVSNNGLLDKGFIWALKGGVLFGKHELAVELSPMTYLPFAAVGPAFQLNASYAYLIAVHESSPVSIYWPMRFGLGTFLGNIGDLKFFELRADMVGLAIQVGHVLIDLHLPSYRVGIAPERRGGVLLSWNFGAGFSYLF